MKHFEAKHNELMEQLESFFKSKGEQLRHIHYTFEKPLSVIFATLNTPEISPIKEATFVRVQLFEFAQPFFHDSEGNTYHFQELSVAVLCLLADHLPKEF